MTDNLGESEYDDGEVKTRPESTFTGRWRIVSMSAWDKDFIDEEEEGYFEFGALGGGEFHFGFVHGNLDGKPTIRDGEPAVEWTWDGNDEMDSAQGRGWAVVRGDELHGMIFFHGGDDSEFVARIMAVAHSRNPERFVHGAPVVKPFPREVWINKPLAPDSQKPPTETKSIPLEKEKQGSVRQGVSQEAPDGPILVNPD